MGGDLMYFMRKEHAMAAYWAVRIVAVALAVAAIVVAADLAGMTAAIAGCGTSGC
jgi:hypothetical protein